MAPHGKVLVNASIRHHLCKNDSSRLTKASRKQSKKESPTIIRINEQFRDFQCLRRGQPHTLSSERDFKSLVSAGLRQSPFLFAVSFDFSLRERFFLREREGFALFDKMIVSHFSPHVNHVKLFHLVVFDLRSVRDPGRSPCPDALLRVGVIRGVDDGLVGVLMDGIARWVIADFLKNKF